MKLRAALCVVLVGPLLAACPRQELAVEAPRPVLVHPVGDVSLTAGAVYTGEIRARHESELAFRVSGKLVERRVDVGAAVRPGQVLARLDPADAGLGAEAARAQLVAARTEHAFAKAEVERYRDLVGRNFVSRSVLDGKEAAFNAAAARVAQATAQAQIAAHQAEYTNLVASQAGVITEVMAEAGQVLRETTPVFKLARDGEREVLIAVPESRIVALREAGPMEVRLPSLPEIRHEGRVREVAPSADPATRTYAVRVRILQPAPEIRLGMTANVILPDPVAAAGAVRVPSRAVFEHQGRSAVWVLKAEGELVRSELRLVRIGQYREDGVWIRDGLKAGERIAAAGVNKIVAGQTLRPRPEPGVVPAGARTGGGQ
ncbi:efflux RND transporter periplasmic adaptor subunit [Zoogloea sp.]|uniref:efflux RND transporter periplasmic adaptor subunit n=1 Tax=Zoogloea sp. TaxID=49181 RepID=UPI00262470A8|nr:efflux RND transporter periplasmic adaptor subunit [Zoogloea sp.]MDD3352805.1 efflux RND transporter periplasmic adaptor subunit [Zoogloea sp.]